MPVITTDVTRSVLRWLVGWLGGWSVTNVSCAQTAERIEMKFGTGTWGDKSNIVLDGGLNPPILGGVRGGGIFGPNGKDRQAKFQRQISRLW